MTPEDKLLRFINDEECLVPVLEYNSRLNFFRMFHLSNDEVSHSNFLAWLLDPHGNHGLGAILLKKMVEQSFGPTEVDWDSFIIKREWRKIDILAISDAEECLLCIENKIGTTEHTNQLNQYRRMTNTYYPNYKKYYIFLSPKGEIASDPENWKSISYADVLRIIDGLEMEACNPDAAVLIRHYAELLRRDIVGDDELKKICQMIYAKHKTALDLIYANKPKSSDVYDSLKSWAEEKAAKGEINLDLENSQKSCLRFTTKVMSKILSDPNDVNSPGHTQNHYYYEIWVMENTHDFFIQISISPANMTSQQQEICKQIMKLREDVQVMGKKKYLNPFVAIHQDYYCLESDDIWMCADQMFKELLEFEREVEEYVKR